MLCELSWEAQHIVTSTERPISADKTYIMRNFVGDGLPARTEIS